MEIQPPSPSIRVRTLGIGVTPSGSWDANIDALQIGEQSMLWSGDTDYTDATWVGTNVYQSGGATKYLTTGVASVYGMQNGQHYWYIRFW